MSDVVCVCHRVGIGVVQLVYPHSVPETLVLELQFVGALDASTGW